MSVKKERDIAILELHRDALKSAQTFEGYRDAHVHYVDMLIQKIRAENETQEAIEKYAIWAAKVIEEWAVT